MLVLRRRLGEGIVIVGPEDVSISILDVNANAVKIGVKAPRDYYIYRNELYAKEKNGTDTRTATTVDDSGNVVQESTEEVLCQSEFD